MIESPVVYPERAFLSKEIKTRSSRDSKNFNLKEDENHDKTGKPVVWLQSQRLISNEVFVSWWRRSRILQQVLQHKNANNPFSEKSKNMIKNE